MELNWSEPKEVHTKYGAKILRKASPTQEFWAEWKSDKDGLKTNGYSLTKTDSGAWEVLHWGALPEEVVEERQATVELSKAHDADVEIPAPEGFEYLPYQKAGIQFASTRDNTLLADEQGLGKFCTLSTLVYTPEGVKRIGDISVGDFVVGSDGKPTKVVGVYPQGEKEIYRVTFNDGFFLDVGKEHLWYVKSPNHLGKSRGITGMVLSTEQLIDKDGFVLHKGVGYNKDKMYRISTYYKKANGNSSWCIPIVKPIEFVSNSVPVDPYLFGVFLGDGSIDKYGKVVVTSHEDDMEEALRGHSRNTKAGTKSTYSKFNEYKEPLKSLGLAKKRSWEKFIPDIYKYNSVAVRLSILQGLMDTGGNAANHATEFSTTSKQLCEDVVELVQTLGGIARVRSRIPRYTYKGEKRHGRLAYRINIKLPPGINPFRLPRKAASYDVPSKYPPNRYISNIEKLEKKQEAVCIAVDAPDRLYVAEHCIVTHNTIQTAGVVNVTGAQTILVVCPASLRLNWKRELSRWLVVPHTIGIVDKSDYPEGTDVVIVNYDVLHRHHDKLRERIWDLLVVDEAHYLKNKSSRRTQQVFGYRNISPIPAKRKLYLTGTPIVNRPKELFPIINSLDPVSWPKFWPFGLRYCDGYQNGFGWDFSGASNLEELQTKLRSTIMIRRLKSEVLTELPPIRRQVIEVPADTAALRKLVKEELSAWEAKEELLMELRAAIQLSKASDNYQDYVDAVSNLKEGTKQAFTDIARIRKEVAMQKVPYVVEHVRNLDGKVVIMAHHKDVVSTLKKEFGDAAVVLDGSTSMEKRQQAVDRFQEDDSVAVFIGSIQAAGVGITLTAAQQMVFAELDWVPGNMSQAESRIHRIGTKGSVLIQHIVLEDSLDARIATILINKQAIIDRALDDDVVIETKEYTVFPSKAKIEEEAELIGAEEIAEIHAKLNILATLDADRASALNGVGFNKMDSTIGHSLATSPRLSPKQAVIGKRLVQKYRRQLGD